jgi:hypothetical protein
MKSPLVHMLELYQACLRNADDLLDEAEILLSHG